MKILAVEFSSQKRSVAVAEASDANAPIVLGTAEEFGGRSVKALAMVEAALAQARLDRAQIECVAVGLGPGSYTGIRAAISLAQGWQLARDVRLVGIGSVGALALAAQVRGLRGDVTFVIDAQRSECYLATYSITERDFQEVESLRIVSRAQVLARLGSGRHVLGPDRIPGAATELLFPEAAVLARLAASSRSFVPGEKLEPIYLREARFAKAPPPRVQQD
jgi:tRNA threonylcarbamoyl adenosine modification protein YeaZ